MGSPGWLRSPSCAPPRVTPPAPLLASARRGGRGSCGCCCAAQNCAVNTPSRPLCRHITGIVGSVGLVRVWTCLVLIRQLSLSVFPAQFVCRIWVVWPSFVRALRSSFDGVRADLTSPHEISEVQSRGVSCMVGRRRVHVGNLGWMSANGVSVGAEARAWCRRPFLHALTATQRVAKGRARCTLGRHGDACRGWRL